LTENAGAAFEIAGRDEETALNRTKKQALMSMAEFRSDERSQLEQSRSVPCGIERNYAFQT
jgi:hypothetical protein